MYMLCCSYCFAEGMQYYYDVVQYIFYINVSTIDRRLNVDTNLQYIAILPLELVLMDGYVNMKGFTEEHVEHEVV